MLELRVTIEAAELAAAINNLAAAMGGAHITPTASQQQAPVIQPPAAPTNFPAPGAPVQQTAPNVPVQQTLPVQPPVQQTPPNIPAPGVPLAPPPQYTTEQIMTAGAALVDAGRVQELMNLLNSFGVQAVTALKPEQLGAFATAMRDMGAKI